MIVTRFAPSPTGFLHLGHAFAALTAARAGERFLLRIEDIDQTRCRPEFEAAIMEDLAWLGLDWEKPVLRQSERFDAYRAALQRLEADGLLYPCFCTRAEIAAEVARAIEAPHNMSLGPEGPIYPGTCRHLTDAQRRERLEKRAAYALRLDAQKAADKVGALSFTEKAAGPQGEHGVIAVAPLLFGDIVLARKETPASYHLSVVVDDAFQGVTLVTRGNDLFAAAHIQRVLQALLGLPAPQYAHHKLILDPSGKKFSKRDTAVTLRSLRADGLTPYHIRLRLLG
ncbi:MAG: tRNA glutamyl-Q(34) synthetase GluQRS [Proteobacteria bacterium]|nr:tRNA glutamyl-Q(34) synthetase GluQRS [Pseudomonadota bacterium]